MQTARGTLLRTLASGRMLLAASVILLLAWEKASSGQWHRVAGLAFIAAGALMNFAVVCANGARMPAQTGGDPPADDGYVAIGPTTRLRFLGDWVHLGRWLISPGDVCLCVGAATSAAAAPF